jgi:hypothetical protein
MRARMQEMIRVIDEAEACKNTCISFMEREHERSMNRYKELYPDISAWIENHAPEYIQENLFFVTNLAQNVIDSKPTWDDMYGIDIIKQALVEKRIGDGSFRDQVRMLMTRIPSHSEAHHH